MSPEKKVKVYFTYDTEDVDLVKQILKAIDYVGIFDVYLSPPDIVGDRLKLDETKTSEILNCDVMIAIFTQRSQRSILVKQEVDKADICDKIVIPFIDRHVKIPKIGDITKHFMLESIERNNLIRVIERIVSIVSLSQGRLGISSEILVKGAKALEDLKKNKILLNAPNSSNDTIQKIVYYVLSRLGYQVGVNYYFLPSPHGFDMIAKRGRWETIGITCFTNGVDYPEVEWISRFAGLSNERWIVCSSYTQKALELADREGVKFILLKELIDKLNSPARDKAWRRFSNLSKFSAVCDSSHSQLKASFETVLGAQTAVEKGKSLESLAVHFMALFPKLEIVKKNVRVESEELDIVVKNENEKVFWQRLGTPIIVECKNWSKPVGASEVRDLIQKMREVKTAFLIAANGITREKGAEYEIIEARKNLKFILVFNLNDFARILKGSNPEEIVQERFYSLWTS
jgi:hypothetical protein